VYSNTILATDSYKASHWLQFPPGTQHVHCYIESRGGSYDRTVFFGLQAFLRQYLSHPITQADIDEADEFFAAHGEPFHREGWLHILAAHGGRLPVEIKAAPEGLAIDTHNVLLTIVNTDPHCFWLPNYLETALLRAIWYPTTVCTVSFKIAILQALSRSSDLPAGDNPSAFKLHDFGARGATSQESAALAGMAHLVNFMGTDTVEGVLAARRAYDEPMAGFSIPAAEHSTITSWGREGEVDAYRNMLRQFAKPGSMVAVVSDSYDLMKVVETVWGGVLKNTILASGATVVVRPDSGDPLHVPVEVLRALDATFGSTVNSKGYKILPPCIRVIQGDGINARSLPLLLEAVMAAGYSVDNIAFGMGGGLHQMLNRDTQKFAMKCSAVCIDGVWHDVSKQPVTDPGKGSKRGRFALVDAPGGYQTVPPAAGQDDLLQAVYRDGQILLQAKFSQVRARAAEAATRLAG
jgi:nicotinamide phosphoribosyltransferase